MLIGTSAVRLQLLNSRVAGIRGIVGHLAQRIGWIGGVCPCPAADRVWIRWS